MRKQTDISTGWQFWRGEETGTAEIVDLPHTPALTPENSSGGCNYQGKCTYKKRVYIPESRKGMYITAELDGAMGVTELWVNGRKAAVHYCGYIPLHADITPYVRYGDHNEIRVCCDNSDREDVPPGKAQDDLDFTYDGGLYRCARLVFRESLHITDELLAHERAGGGIYLWSERISDTDVRVCAKVHVRNMENRSRRFRIRLSIGESIWQEQVMEGGAAHFLIGMELKNVKRWSPEDPKLYTVGISLWENEECQDAAEVNFGIREFVFTYQNNLVYNGIQRRLSGGNYHFAYPYVGNAVPDNLLRRDIRKLKNLGMENIRSHYPMPDAVTDECNRLGITLIVSNPGWQWYEDGAFAERLIENMRQIVRWQRNNPAVLLWEPVPNESVVPENVQQRLHDVVHEECPYGCCFTASDHGPTDVSYRMYDPGMLEPGMEGYSPMYRYGGKSDYPVWIREYNDAPDNWQDQSCAWRTPRRWGDHAQLRAVERMLGMDAQSRENNYIDVYNNKMICGYGIWPAIEYNRGYHINPCWGGLLDIFRVPKMTAYFMESQQDPEQAGCKLYIANWWTDISPADVTVFSNAEKVRLYHNDMLVEEREAEPLAVKHPPFIFKDVRKRFRGRDRSELRAEGIIGGRVAEIVRVKTPGVPFRLCLEPDMEGFVPEKRGDMLAVRCIVTDREGTTVPYAADRHPILFEIEGGEIVGDDSIGANPICPEAGIATVLIRPAAENVTVRAGMFRPGTNQRVAIRPAELEIKCDG